MLRYVPLGRALGPSKGVFRPITWTVKTVRPTARITRPAENPAPGITSNVARRPSTTMVKATVVRFAFMDVVPVA